jgi:mitogen-activated protein kinase 1/3
VKVGHETFTVDVRYTKLKRIGNGSYGFVVSALDTATNRQVAIKKITNTFDDLIDAKRILREIKLLRHFNSHENVITIQDMILMPPDTVDFKDVYIVTNLMESDLDRIIASNQQLTDQHFQ